jgi:hypothetical protein
MRTCLARRTVSHLTSPTTSQRPPQVLNSLSFAVATVLIAGVNLFAMALVIRLLLGWPIPISIVLAAGIVLVYITLGGLSSAEEAEASDRLRGVTTLFDLRMVIGGLLTLDGVVLTIMGLFASEGRCSWPGWPRDRCGPRTSGVRTTTAARERRVGHGLRTRTGLLRLLAHGDRAADQLLGSAVWPRRASTTRDPRFCLRYGLLYLTLPPQEPANPGSSVMNPCFTSATRSSLDRVPRSPPAPA